MMGRRPRYTGKSMRSASARMPDVISRCDPYMQECAPKRLRCAGQSPGPLHCNPPSVQSLVYIRYCIGYGLQIGLEASLHELRNSATVTEVLLVGRTQPPLSAHINHAVSVCCLTHSREFSPWPSASCLPVAW